MHNKEFSELNAVFPKTFTVMFITKNWTLGVVHYVTYELLIPLTGMQTCLWKMTVNKTFIDL